jgi:hypothetical protein
MKRNFSRHIFEKKKAQIPSFIKIRLVRAELFHVGGQTDMTRLMVSFRNFCSESSTYQCVRAALDRAAESLLSYFIFCGLLFRSK